MTVALSAEQRSSLEKLVQSARRWIEEDLEAKLAGSFGIHPNGRIEDVGDLSLSNAQASVRQDLVEIVEFLRSEGEDDDSSVARLVREAAFTQTNRLIAVRVAEAIGLLPETLAKGTASSGFRDFSELAPTVATTEWGRFAEFLRLCADELAADVPALFDPRNPLLELTMSESVLAKVVEAMASLNAEHWAAPDALGWAYQFFNTGEERREMRESSAPRTSRELAVRNQFFTPSYVVEFLVHNGLGAHLAAGFPGMADELPLLVEVPTEAIEVDLEAVSVLDPACGSGHFLLGAYDVLERAWHHCGVGPAEAAPAIVRSLWGIDIDPRAAQIAQAAVMFRARRHCRDEKLPVANVICARSLPSGPEIDVFIASLPEHVGRAVKGIADEMVDAPFLGPLLKIEERLDREVRDVFGSGVVEGTLSEHSRSESENVEAAVLGALSAIADSTTSTASQRLFAAEAHDAVRFVEAMSRRYTAVLMNPPFGEPISSTKTYLRRAYDYLPSNCDLFAAFVGRGLDLCEEGGTVGAITSRVGLFLASFEKWRRSVLLDNDLSVLADLGFGVMEQALVEAAAYVVQARAHQSTSTATFIRLLRDRDRPHALGDAIAASADGTPSSRVFKVATGDFESLPRSPIAYWAGPIVRQLFKEYPPIEGAAAEVRAGLCTGDDFRFIRCSWEVEPEQSYHAATSGGRWVPFAKGGEYSPLWADVHLVVDWERSGGSIRDADLPGTRVQNAQFYFRPGVTWPLRTASGFGPRVLPPDAIFGHKGPGALTRSAEGGVALLGWLTTRLARALLDVLIAAGDETTSGTASKSYEVGLIQRLPWPGASIPPPIMKSVDHLVKHAVERRAHQDETVETARRFVAPALLSHSGSVSERLSAARAEHFALCLDLIDNSYAVEGHLYSSLGLSPTDLDYLNDEVGAHPGGYPTDPLIDEAEFAQMFGLPTEQLINTVLATQGGSRSVATMTFVADRRLEVLAHAFERHPAVLVETVTRLGLAPPGEARRALTDLTSYLVGVAFGRWDVRVGREPNSAADILSGEFDPVPICAPATLVGPTGLPTGKAPEGYPLGLPPHHLLLDQPGHEWDIEAAVVRSAGLLVEDSDVVLVDVIHGLGRRSVRDVLRKQFFKDHLSQYSRSRRKAPIYWQLQVPSKTWGVWLYAPKLSREMLFAIVRETEQRQRLAEQQIGHLEREAETGAGGRKASEVAKELEAEQKLAVELASFRAEAERIANLGWEPDLDDGIVLNAAPLADLFPAWKDAAAYRKELRAGKHEWATVARFADQL